MDLGIYHSSPLAVIKVTGEDSAEFLQGQSTQDIRGSAGIVRYGLWLNHLGKIYGDSFILKLEDETFLLISYSTPADVIMNKLNRFIIADDVELENRTDSYANYSILGTSSQNWIERMFNSIPEDGNFIVSENRIIFSGRRSDDANFEVLAQKEKSFQVDESELKKLSSETMERIRIKAGIQLIGVDLNEEDTPESGKLATSISHTKGCYLGQEVVARMHRLGRVGVKSIRIFWTDNYSINRGEPIYSEDKCVGILTSYCSLDNQYLGFAKIKTSAIENKMELKFSGNRSIYLFEE